MKRDGTYRNRNYYTSTTIGPTPLCVCAEEISCSPLPCPSFFLFRPPIYLNMTKKKSATRAFATTDPVVGSEDPLSSLQVEDEDRYRTAAVELNFVSSFLDKAAIGPSSNQYDTTLLIGTVGAEDSSLFYSGYSELYPRVIDHLGLEIDLGIFMKMTINCGTEAAATSKAATSTTLVRVRGDSFAAQQFIMGVLPITHCRNEHPMMVHAITQLVKENVKGNTRIIVLTDGFPVGPLASGRYSIVIHIKRFLPVVLLFCFVVNTND